MTKKKKRNQNKKNNFITNLLLVASIILILSILYIDILPIKYLLYIGIFIGILDLILIFIKKKSKRKLLPSIIPFLLSIIMLVVSFYILKTDGLLNNLNLNYKTYNYKVVVLKDSNYNKLNDIEDKQLGYYKTDGKETTKSLNKLASKVNTNNKEYDNTETLVEDLLNKRVDAILIEETHLTILEEHNNDTEAVSKINNNINNFSDKTKIIYEFTIIVKTDNFSKDIDVTKKPFNVYISGIDTYGEISSVSRSDVNMVVTVNPETKQILLTSIPRDYYVKLHDKTGYNDKLTHAGLYGVDTSLKTIEDLLNIEINYYVKVNFSSVIDIVEALGGVEVYSDYSFTSIDGYNYTKGYNKVNGEEALSFARERKSFNAGDRQRVKNQQALLEAMFRKCTSASIITKYNSLLNSVNKSFVTNMPTDRLTALLKMQLKNRYKWIITSNSLEGSNSSNYTYSYSASKLYVMEPDEESVAKATSLINSVINGEILDSSYSDNPTNAKSVTKNTPTKQEEKVITKKDTPKEGLKINLGKDKIEMEENEEYIYYGYTATYNNEIVTDNTKYELTINNKTFTDYKELVYYITNNLKEGTYNIEYKITYNGESKTQSQQLIITKKEKVSEEPIEEPEHIEEEEEITEENNTINE